MQPRGGPLSAAVVNLLSHLWVTVRHGRDMHVVVTGTMRVPGAVRAYVWRFFFRYWYERDTLVVGHV